MSKADKSEVLIAKESFAIEYGGETIVVKKGDRVRAGHAIVKAHEDLFEASDSHIRFDVEQAAAAPDEKRGKKE